MLGLLPNSLFLWSNWSGWKSGLSYQNDEPPRNSRGACGNSLHLRILDYTQTGFVSEVILLCGESSFQQKYWYLSEDWSPFVKKLVSFQAVVWMLQHSNCWEVWGIQTRAEVCFCRCLMPWCSGITRYGGCVARIQQNNWTPPLTGLQVNHSHVWEVALSAKSPRRGCILPSFFS